MTNLSVVPDELLKMATKVEPQFPMCTAECISWSLEHQDCRGCKYFPQCQYFVLGLEIGTERVFKKLGLGQGSKDKVERGRRGYLLRYASPKLREKYSK